VTSHKHNKSGSVVWTLRIWLKKTLYRPESESFVEHKNIS
jgi:hypothetical protein